MRNQRIAPSWIDQVKGAIARVRGNFVGKVKASGEVAEQAPREDGHLQVWRFVIASGSGFRRGEVKRPLAIRPAAGKLLPTPQLDQAVRDRFAVAVEELAFDPDRRRARSRVSAGLKWKRVAEKWADRLRGSRYSVFAQAIALLAWRCDHAV
jgi:hypothetical protein